MELFLPSLLILLIAGAVIFFVLPKFGPATLAIISLALLVFGIYQHMNTFGTEYRLSTWQMAFSSFTPFIMLGGVFFVIAIYFLFLAPSGEATAVELPTLKTMPSAESATNAVTEGINKTIKSAANVLGLAKTNNTANKSDTTGNNTTKNNTTLNNKGNKPNSNKSNNTNNNNNDESFIQRLINKYGNNSKSNNLKKPNVAGEPRMVPGLADPLSRV